MFERVGLVLLWFFCLRGYQAKLIVQETGAVVVFCLQGLVILDASGFLSPVELASPGRPVSVSPVVAGPASTATRRIMSFH